MLWRIPVRLALALHLHRGPSFIWTERKYVNQTQLLHLPCMAERLQNISHLRNCTAAHSWPLFLHWSSESLRLMVSELREGAKKKKDFIDVFCVFPDNFNFVFLKRKKKEKRLFSNGKVRCQSANCLVYWSKRFPIFTKMTLKTSQTGAWTRRSQSNNAETSCCAFYIVMFFFH